MLATRPLLHQIRKRHTAVGFVCWKGLHVGKCVLKPGTIVIVFIMFVTLGVEHCGELSNLSSWVISNYAHLPNKLSKALPA